MKWWPLLFAGCAAGGPEVMERVGERFSDSQARVWSNEVTLACEPTDAVVSLDGIPRGNCSDFRGEPRGLALPSGMHRVEVKKTGFWPYETWIDSDGTRAALTVKLQPVQ